MRWASQRKWLIAGLAVLLLTGLALALRSRRLTELSMVKPTGTPAPLTVALASPTLTPTPTATPTATEMPTPTPTPTPAGGGGSIVYAWDGDLVAADVTTGEIARLTFDPDPERDPALSPDGRRLAFAARRGANWDLYRLDLGNGSVVRLTEHPDYDGHPSWSPNGDMIAFETLRGGDLDIYLLPAEGGEARPLVDSPAAETSPSWSPDGRWLVYSAHVAGQRDLYLIPLAGGEPINLTASPAQHEDEPAFSPDGRELAYSVGLGGERMLYVAPMDLTAGRLITASVRLVGTGAGPAWSPDGGSLVAHAPLRRSPRLQVIETAGFNRSVLTFQADLLFGGLAWGQERLPQTAIERARTAPPTLQPTPLYVEVIAPTPTAPPYYRFVRLPVRTHGPYLSDRVDDSFRALRQRVIDETGYDYLSVFGDMWRGIDASACPGQSERSWHKAGRAFDINQGPYGPGQDVVIVLETFGGRVFWRVYFRTARQDGTQGEPLRAAPWNWSAQSGPDGAPTGGAPSFVIPSGYWLDFTALAAEYGWHSVAALRRWRTYYPDTDWWHFQKTDGLSWVEAMREVYPEEEIEEVFGLR
jgi:TolB protein